MADEQESLEDKFIEEAGFKTEVEAFMAALLEMLKHHEDEWVAFKREEDIGYFSSEQDCINMAYREWGDEQFLVRQISRDYITYGKMGKPIEIPNLRQDEDGEFVYVKNGDYLFGLN